MLAIISFIFVGLYAVVEIQDYMKKEYEELKKKQKEVKDIVDLVHTGGYS